MMSDSEAWAKVSGADNALREAQRELLKAKLGLVKIRKAKALADLQEYPQHAEIILEELVTSVVNIVREV